MSTRLRVEALGRVLPRAPQTRCLLVLHLVVPLLPFFQLAASIYPRSRPLHEGTVQIRKLGSGASGTVNLVQLRDGTLSACKTINLAIGNARRNPLGEIAILEKLSLSRSHSGIVRYLASCVDAHVLRIFMEYLPGGTLQDLVVDRSSSPLKTVPVQEMRFLACDLLAAVEFVHSQGITHRDIKPTNIVLDYDHKPKLVDFDVSRDIPVGGATTFVGSSWFLAPEVERRIPYTEKADIGTCLKLTILRMAAARTGMLI